MNLHAFANPWEHARLLSDAARNAKLIQLLRRHAAGARVLEVGCGTGLLACVAARLGAREVWAVEPTGIADIAREVVAANQLGDVVHVLDERVEDLPPRPVDLAFSELLNADPFSEGVLGAMHAAAGWLAPSGLLAPSRLRVWTALARVSGPAAEARSALAEVGRAAHTFGLDLTPLTRGLSIAGAYRYTGADLAIAGPPVLLWDLRVGGAERPEPTSAVALAGEPGPVGGVVVWFSAALDADLELSNPPGAPGHWGQLVCAWPRERGLRAGEALAIRAWVGAQGVQVEPL